MPYLDLIPLASHNGSTDGYAFVSRWSAACRAGHAAEQSWITSLRQQGVVAAHPDDGWVDRAEHSVRFAYPQFIDRDPQPGDIIALGWHDGHRLVVVTKRVESRFFSNFARYLFKPRQVR